jgi:4-hydroxy-4-methyl-2-oxoglutarate aldolase
MNQGDEIIEYIRRNRVSTTEVADALGKTGVLSRVFPLTPDQFRVGRVRCVFTANNSNHAMHDQIRDVQKGDVVVIFAYNCTDRAIFGDLVTRYMVLYRQVEAVVVNGLVRDAARLRRERYPVWCQGATPLGCFNVPAKPFPAEQAQKIRQEMENGVAVCDDGGVTVIPTAKLDMEMMSRLERIELQEDVWYFCLNTLKWDTKRIVCDKDYLKTRELLPRTYTDQLARLEEPLDKKPQ